MGKLLDSGISLTRWCGIEAKIFNTKIFKKCLSGHWFDKHLCLRMAHEEEVSWEGPFIGKPIILNKI